VISSAGRLRSSPKFGMGKYVRILGIVFGTFNIGIGVLVDKLNPVIAGASLLLLCFSVAYLMDFNWKS